MLLSCEQAAEILAEELLGGRARAKALPSASSECVSRMRWRCLETRCLFHAEHF